MFPAALYKISGYATHTTSGIKNAQYSEEKEPETMSERFKEV